jgi:hypothetical protein
MSLRLTNSIPSIWSDQTAAGSYLTMPNGLINEGPNELICSSGPSDNETVITLTDAIWDSAAGDSGKAACDTCDIKLPKWMDLEPIGHAVNSC